MIHMKKIITFILLSISLHAFSQDLKTINAQIMEEAIALLKSEKASWYGTDLFLENYKEQSNIGGYFSYTQDSVSKCIFFSKSKEAKVIGEIAFDSTFNLETAKVDLTERDFHTNEKDLHQIRIKSLELVRKDTLFKSYKRTRLNIIPFIYKGKKKAYVLTGPEVSGVVIIGNDYLINFDENNNVTDRKELHKNIIPIEYEEGDRDGVSIHSHQKDTGDFMTVTDVCTLLLYSNYTKWESHIVVSEKYMNMLDLKSNTLISMTMEAYENMTKNASKKEEENKKPKDSKKQ